LKNELEIPPSNIETDSYIAVQILEKLGELSEKSLAKMAEKVSGSFVFTLLDKRNNSYFVKGDNPLALYHFKAGFYIYASTNSILDKALNMLGLAKFPYDEIQSDCGDILKIDRCGKLTRSHFQYNDYPCYRYTLGGSSFEDGIGLHRLNQYAGRCGIDECYIDLLLDYGYTIEEVEDLICVPNAIETAVEEILCEFDYCEEW
ncbi:MAG: glucosamine 6-phosphate synthetase, partial [Oscillospiraceae bacterium]|nr:glucosamine 6-phosphate synthetase [Oscillospiraceae bacterium]